jgi:hypothetical protein
MSETQREADPQVLQDTLARLISTPDWDKAANRMMLTHLKMDVQRMQEALSEAQRKAYAQLWQDLWPAGGKGGGKSAAHVQLHHLANLCMGMAASQPVEAVQTVMTLRRLRHVGREVVYRKHEQTPHAPTELTGSFNTRLTGSIYFGTALEHLIADGQTPGWRNSWAIRRRGVEIILCTIPASAEISWRSSDGHWSDHFLPPEQQEMPFAPEAAYAARPARRVTIFPYAVITACGELLQDTLARQTPTPTHANAETLPGASASTRDQPATRTNDGPEPHNTPERKGKGEEFQPPSYRQAGRGSPRRR